LNRKHGKKREFNVVDEVKSFKALRWQWGKAGKFEVGYDLETAIYVMSRKRPAT
jgi:hypothetical protein